MPEPLFLEEDESVLGAPFSVMSQIEGSLSDVSQLNESQQQSIGAQKWQILGELAR